MLPVDALGNRLACLNPSGLADGARANRVGQDINR